MRALMLTRRAALLAALATAGALGAGCAQAPVVELQPPIVFVHGNGDTAALWSTTLWRFESNGWPRSRLHAIDMPYPLARDADDKEQPGRTSSVEARQFLAAEVDKVLKATGAQKVVLFANSRGGNAIRSYIAQGGGAAKVSHAILGGTPNHGVWSNPAFRPTNEFNGAGPFLTALNNQGGPGIEITPGVKWMTIRSDNNDKFAQPDGLWIGMKGKPTNVTFAGPELKGATNVVIPRIDHRETSYSAAAFEATYRFITGRTPALGIQTEASVLLNGKVVGLGLNPQDAQSGNFVNNLPLAGAGLEVYEIDPLTGQRKGGAVHQKTVGADGLWGPFKGTSQAAYEFVITAKGYATTHIYRSPFPRSSGIVHMKPERIAPADQSAQSLVSFVRPRGYFDPQRDQMRLDGKTSLPGVPPGAGVASSKLRLNDKTQRTVAAEFNGERLVGLTWPLAEGRTTVLELTY